MEIYREYWKRPLSVAYLNLRFILVRLRNEGITNYFLFHAAILPNTNKSPIFKDNICSFS